MSLDSLPPDANAPLRSPASPTSPPSTATRTRAGLTAVGLVAACLAAVAVGKTAGAAPVGDAAIGDMLTALALPASTLPISTLPISTGPMLALVQPTLPKTGSPVQLAAQKSKSLALPRASGLTWSSGAGCYTGAFDNWRGRPSDIYTFWAAQSTWSEAIRSISWYQKYASMSGRLSLGLPMLTRDTRGRFDMCNRGAYDSQVREIGRRLQSLGLGDSIVRLGWEMNHSSFPWAVPPDQKSAYKSCFQRQANLLRSQAPNLLIEWNPKKGNSYGYDVRDIFPGSAYVDIIGVDFYDGWAAMNNESQWNRNYNATKYGGPNGIGSWLAFARSQGKRLAVPEWGVCQGCNDPQQTDNPFFIRKMNDFFRSNSSDIAYESYFNCTYAYKGKSYRLFPVRDNPRASAEYQARW